MAKKKSIRVDFMKCLRFLSSCPDMEAKIFYFHTEIFRKKRPVCKFFGILNM